MDVSKQIKEFIIDNFLDKIKLIEPTDETLPVYRAARKGGGMHHLGFRCKDVKEEMTRLKV